MPFDVTLDPEGLEGRVRREITLYSDSQQIGILEVKANVVAPFAISRRHVHFAAADAPQPPAEILITPAIHIDISEDGPVSTQIRQEPQLTRILVGIRATRYRQSSAVRPSCDCPLRRQEARSRSGCRGKERRHFVCPLLTLCCLPAIDQLA